MTPVRPSVPFNLVDGVIRMVFFIAMIWTFSRLRRYQAGLRVSRRRTQDGFRVGEWRRIDRRQCAALSAAASAVRDELPDDRHAGFDSPLLDRQVRLTSSSIWSRGWRWFLLIAGISYEIIRAAGKKESSAFFAFITRPGIWMQNLTTREPSDDQLEVAIFALNESLKLEPGMRELRTRATATDVAAD